MSSYRLITGTTPPPPWLSAQRILEKFIARFKAPSAPKPAIRARGISRKHRSALALPLQAYLEKYMDRDEAIARAHASASYTIDVIAQHFKVSHKTAARAIKRWRGLLNG